MNFAEIQAEINQIDEDEIKAIYTRYNEIKRPNVEKDTDALKKVYDAWRADHQVEYGLILNAQKVSNAIEQRSSLSGITLTVEFLDFTFTRKPTPYMPHPQPRTVKLRQSDVDIMKIKLGLRDDDEILDFLERCDEVGREAAIRDVLNQRLVDDAAGEVTQILRAEQFLTYGPAVDRLLADPKLSAEKRTELERIGQEIALRPVEEDTRR